MKMEKIDRPIVKMVRIKDNGTYDFHWYSTMMGKQRQIIEIIKGTNDTLERIHEMDQTQIDLLENIRDGLQKEVDSYNDRVFMFRPWNLFKKKKDVGN